MARKKDVFPGARFGLLTVLNISGSKIASGKKRNFCNCRCKCGKVVEVRIENLGRSKYESCGCYKKSCVGLWGEKALGLSDTRLYVIWTGMKQRCYNQKSKAYKDYGGRGIKICDEWKDSFLPFYHWALISGYSENLTIDRININGNYSPDNCQWITIQEQQAVGKKRINPLYRHIEYDGLNLTMKEWSLRLGGNSSLVALRIRKGWDQIQAITKPVDISKANRRKIV